MPCDFCQIIRYCKFHSTKSCRYYLNPGTCPCLCSCPGWCHRHRCSWRLLCLRLGVPADPFARPVNPTGRVAATAAAADPATAPPPMPPHRHSSPPPSPPVAAPAVPWPTPSPAAIARQLPLRIVRRHRLRVPRHLHGQQHTACNLHQLWRPLPFCPTHAVSHFGDLHLSLRSPGSSTGSDMPSLQTLSLEESLTPSPLPSTTPISEPALPATRPPTTRS